LFKNYLSKQEVLMFYAPTSSRTAKLIHAAIAVSLVLLFATPVYPQNPAAQEDPVIPEDVFAENDALTSASVEARAATVCIPGLGGRVFSTGAFVQIVVQEPFADFTSQIKLFAPGPVRTLASSRDVGRVINLGTFPAGTELVFGITVQETRTTFKMGPGARNPDRVPHAIVECLGDGNANVGFEDKVNSDSLDYNDVRFQIRQIPPSAAQVTFKPPFQFFNGCTDSREFGESSVTTFSRPVNGDLRLTIQTTFVGEAFGRTGAGVTYVPDFSGPITIKSFVSIGPPSADALYSLDPGLVPTGAVLALNSDVFVKLDGSPPGLDRFRMANINTLKPGAQDILRFFPKLAPIIRFLPNLAANSHIYRPAELYVARLDTIATQGQPIRICGGLQSSAVSVGVPILSAISAKYDAKLLRIVIEPR
jgi:hypothetical protein